VGQSLDRAQDNYRQAMKKLTSGRGNLLAQAESFRSLGVEVKREINPDLAEYATSQDEEYRLREASDAQVSANKDNELTDPHVTQHPLERYSQGG
ncbi:DNA recombination protein RmuC, partial [Escherichia coli]|nr:DNA recombination protein RmuC [Escherichia coli]